MPPRRRPAPVEDAEPRRIPDLRRLLERAVNGTAHDDGWASLSSIANHVTRVEPSFSVKDYGASKLVDLVRAQDYLEVEQPEGGSVRVRLTTTTNRPNKKDTAKKTAAKKTSTRKSDGQEVSSTCPRAGGDSRAGARPRAGTHSRAGEAAHGDHSEAVGAEDLALLSGR